MVVGDSLDRRHRYHQGVSAARAMMILKSRNVLLACLIIAPLSVVGGVLSASIARPISSQQISVIDGDTIHVAGERANVRLVDFNAPETRNAECGNEHDLGDRATRRLKELVATARLDFTKVACSCAPGTEGTSRCNYGRSCGTLRADGTDVGAMLISEGLAVPFICGRTTCPPTPRPWCR